MPPKLFHRFFRWYCHPRLRDGIEGDLIEFYRERLNKSGKRIADFLFIIDVVLLFRPGIIKPAEGHKNLNNFGMFKNYFTIGWRNLLRSKGYSAINIGGLAAGMAVTILIGMWIYDELSFNRSFKTYDRLGRIMVHNKNETYESHPLPLAEELRRNFPADFKYVAMGTWENQYAIASRDANFIEHGMFMEPDGPEIFGLEMIYGTRNALREPNTILISETLARKLYGDAEPIGQIARWKNSFDVRIGGVYKDFPPNTRLYQTAFINSFEALLAFAPWMKEQGWEFDSKRVYVLLNDGVDFEEISLKIKDFKMKFLSEESKKGNQELFVQPVGDWHLYSEYSDRKVVMSDQLQFVWLYGIIGAFVLILACINFMNLSTARSEKRAKEVGIRKTMGSQRNQLIIQFFSESFITVGFAAIGAIIIVVIALPLFNEVAAKQISIPWTNSIFWISILGFAFMCGILAGSYPALYLSAFRPVKVLKGTFHTGRFASLPRKILVVLQFTVSVLLIVGTLVVYQQIQHAKDRPVGYNREGLLNVFMITSEFYQHYDAIRNELLSSQAADMVALSSSPISEVWDEQTGFDWEGKPEGKDPVISVNWAAEGYGATVGWRFVQGRDFSPDIGSDTSAIVINKALARVLGFPDPIDQVVKWNNKTSHIIGVIEDIVMGSPYEPVLPSMFFHDMRNHTYIINIRLNQHASIQESIEKATRIFQKYNPSVPFQYKFIDEEYENKFASEVRVGKLASVFAALAIIISLLGLFGLSSFVAERRTKEIGIRKVVGASLWNLWTMLTGNFALLVMISCLVAFPVAWYALSNWLQRFEYRIDIQWWIFPLVALGALLVTLITVSYQAIRAALANPVESLRSE